MSEALIERLIDVADAAGYGPADETFALLMVDTCRDVESGYSAWEDLIAQDVADGAPRADAVRFYDFLRDEFCAGLKPTGESKQPDGDKNAVSDGTRGLGSKTSFLDANRKHGSLRTCRAATGTPLGDPRAYVVRPGVLMCAAHLKGGAWGDTLISIDVVFEPSVSESGAREIALRLLPKDATIENRFEHTNPSWAARKGSCVSLVFTSSILGDAISQANSDWSDTDEATATLYSEKQTDYGSASEFDGTARVLSLSIGGNTSDSNC